MNYSEIILKHGNGGYWCQGGCVFIEGDHPTEAISCYRQKLQQGEIGVSVGEHCGDIRAKNFAEQLTPAAVNPARQALNENDALVESVFQTCGLDGAFFWTSEVGDAYSIFDAEGTLLAKLWIDGHDYWMTQFNHPPGGKTSARAYSDQEQWLNAAVSMLNRHRIKQLFRRRQEEVSPPQALESQEN